ncbi:hypothetical protein BpHYR1_002621 [Brachionus plicatilis]|uniref:Transmembrane protein n=1 Tax=Brachionus plicatilis TaxID=10195 RepID=A0A3M7SEI7_BRAPC|nr:hypothetical protein BpHYR1_002621 [Brachionus plicatilis]
MNKFKLIMDVVILAQFFTFIIKLEKILNLYVLSQFKNSPLCLLIDYSFPLNNNESKIRKNFPNRYFIKKISLIFRLTLIPFIFLNLRKQLQEEINLKIIFYQRPFKISLLFDFCFQHSYFIKIFFLIDWESMNMAVPVLKIFLNFTLYLPATDQTFFVFYSFFE